MMRSFAVGLVVAVLAACNSSSNTAHRNTSSSDEDPPGDEDTPRAGHVVKPDRVARVDRGSTDEDPPPGDEDNSSNVPPDTVTVGGPPDTCQVYEFDVPVERPAYRHFPEGTSYAYANNPPSGGPSFEMWADYRRYTEPVDRERWVHNLRHGAIVMIYRPDAPAEVVDALAAALPLIPTPEGKYQAKPDCPHMGIMTPDPMLDDTFAVLAFGKMMTSNCAPTTEDIVDFAERHIYEGEEKECYGGAWPIRGPCQRYEDVRRIQWTYEAPEGTAITYDDEPPSSGPFYANTLRYGRYDAAVPTPYWTGILAKGGIVILYRPDAPAEMIDGMKAAFDALPTYGACGNSIAAMIEDPSLATPYAMVGFGHYMEGQCFQGWEMAMFVTSRRGWGPFNSCDDGTYTP